MEGVEPRTTSGEASGDTTQNSPAEGAGSPEAPPFFGLDRSGGIQREPSSLTEYLLDEQEASAIEEMRAEKSGCGYVPRAEPAAGWTRIGRYDSAQRRSLWCRLIGEDETGHVQAIELCSGREGDDAYVKLTAEDPQWIPLCDLLLRVHGDCGVAAPPFYPQMLGACRAALEAMRVT